MVSINVSEVKPQMAQDFFDDKEEQTNTNTPQTFSIGDKQYTQDELNDLVSRGEMSREVEERYNTDLSKVYPEYIKTTQKLKDLEAQQTQWESQQIAQKVQQGQQLSPDEIRDRALEEASTLGLWNDRNAPQRLNDMLDGRDLRSETDEIVDDLEAMGIQTDRDTILDYMDQNDISLPERAADELYEYMGRLRTSQEEGMESLRDGEDYFTFEGEGNQGMRIPTGTKVDDNNIMDLLSEVVNG